ncbi:protein FAM98A [Caerostris extrusa]|uniref:Protein FAM98A n=1 Tax=Caerostris extrusa TaxID=172846 RepID=A0AAV4Y054_CAEEX|nr:protein FAM98A [Caerostris extrusa]
MEQIRTDLTNLGYQGEALNVLNQVLSEGPPNIYFVDVVSWLSSELGSVYDLESHISPIIDEEDAKSIAFFVEVSSLLKELCCPIKTLIKGSIENRLSSSEDKIFVIVYLCQELEAGKILAHKKPKKKEATLKIELSESKTAKELKDMLISLGFAKPPDDITPQKLFVELKMICQPTTPKELVGGLLFSGYLTEKQWFQLDKLFREVYQEYKTRRNLLLTRLDVTIQSFLWTDRLKNKSEEVTNNYKKTRSRIIDDPSVKISDILSATADLAAIEKTSSASVRKNTKSAVNKVIISAVPDRGGRPEEQQAPPPEVPSWQKNDNSSRGGFRGGSQQNSGNYRNSGNRDAPRDRHRTDNRLSNGSYQKGGNYNRSNDYSTPTFNPVYQQPVQYISQVGAPQCGFGGFMPAGDNFQQYGRNDGINQFQPRQNPMSGPRQRGGARPYRGGQGRRGGW